jgi:hypothetical protein
MIIIIHDLSRKQTHASLYSSFPKSQFQIQIPFTRRIYLEGPDAERRSRGDNLDGGNPVLDGELDSDLQTLPVLGLLGDIITDLLGGQTEGTDLFYLFR